jgi:hypothetical protein
MKTEKKPINPMFLLIWVIVMIGLLITTINEYINPPKPETGTRVVYTITSDKNNAWAAIEYLGRNGSKFSDDAVWHLPCSRTVYLNAGDVASVKARLLGSGGLSCTINLVDTPSWRASDVSGKNPTVECSGTLGQK